MISIIWNLFKILVTVVIVIAISQIEIRGKTVENYVHEFLNSKTFKKNYAKVTDHKVIQEVKKITKENLSRVEGKLPSVNELREVLSDEKKPLKKKISRKLKENYDEKALEKVIDSSD